MDQIEFEEDLDRIKYIKRLLRKYEDGKEIERKVDIKSPHTYLV
jgi:hypothetical protein